MIRDVIRWLRRLDGEDPSELERVRRRQRMLGALPVVSLAVAVLALGVVIRQDTAARAAVKHWRDEVGKMEKQRQRERAVTDFLLALARPPEAGDADLVARMRADSGIEDLSRHPKLFEAMKAVVAYRTLLADESRTKEATDAAYARVLGAVRIAREED